MSHLGRPNGNRYLIWLSRVEKDSLKIVVPKLEELLGTKVNFVNDCVGGAAAEAANAGNG